MCKLFLLINLMGIALCGCTHTEKKPLLVSQYKLQIKQVNNHFGGKNYTLCQDCIHYSDFQKNTNKTGDDKHAKSKK